MDKTTPCQTNIFETAADLFQKAELTARVKRHPYEMLMAALGAGYVLGGGLFTRLTARTVKLGLRTGASLAAGPLLIKGLGDLADAIMAARDARRSSVGAGTRPVD